ncbi:MAG: HD domain-containing protein [Deltaproteobacteria bacterium]|nr:HD domain-containing protein [Deltaproteobacteria bacterium]
MNRAALPFDPAVAKEQIAQARRALGEGRLRSADYLAVVDGTVSALGRAAQWDVPGRALIALGGYGRGELSPRSDIDLLFLSARSDAPRNSVEAVLYPLWDLGFDVGHGLRTPRECARLATEDLAAATALLDARLLLGDASLLEDARRKAGIRPGGSREMRRWVGRILTEVAGRRERFGEVSHLLEPHIKEGKGGLRDFQAARWILTCLGQTPGTVAAETENAAGAQEGYDFLIRARNALHAVAGRKTDHLTFDLHREVAQQVFPGAPVEDFFAALHRASHAVLSAWEELAPAAREALAPRLLRRPLSDAAPRGQRLAQALAAWARSGDPMPPPLRHAVIRGEAGVVGGALVEAVAGTLRSRVPLAPLLHEIHRLGRLSLVAPEVEAVAHQVHYDARHAFTTGVHCIETLAVFEDLWLGLLEKEEPHLTRIAGAVARPPVARLAALCHDLGKGQSEETGEGHAEAGIAPATSLALRLGFDEEEADAVAALVRQHRAIPSIAFGRDLESPASWAEARRASAPPAGLEELVVLAYADLKATNPKGWSGVWSDWKRDLLLTLYARASAETPTAARAPIGAAKDSRVPPREAAQIPPDLLGHLLQLAQELGDRPAAWKVDLHAGGLAEILGVAHATPRLLSAVTGALAGLRFDILSFQVHTWADGSVHLWIRAAHSKTPPGAEEVARHLTGSLTGEVPAFRPRRSALRDPRTDAIPVEQKIRMRDGDDPYHSVLEVRCRDRQGLIRDLARAFEHHGLTVTYALVTTVGPMAQDVFHLRDIFGGRVEGDAKVRALLASVAAASEVAGPGESEYTRTTPPG